MLDTMFYNLKFRNLIILHNCFSETTEEEITNIENTIPLLFGHTQAMGLEDRLTVQANAV